MARVKLASVSLALCLIASPALAEDAEFSLGNQTGKTMTAVEVSPTGKESWTKQNGADIRKMEVKTGSAWTVHFDRDKDTCKYDFRVTFKGGATDVFPGVDVCKDAWGDFVYKDGKPTVAIDDD